MAARILGLAGMSVVILAILLYSPIIFYLGQTVFRIYYYGELAANTALVKLAPSLHHATKGELQHGASGFGWQDHCWASSLQAAEIEKLVLIRCR